jgi:hypothetical protein
MIQITLRENDPISQLITARASQTGRDATVIADEIIHESLYALVERLHEQFMRGEISQGYMAEKLGVSRVDLIHLLEAMDLQVTNL